MLTFSQVVDIPQSSKITSFHSFFWRLRVPSIPLTHLPGIASKLSIFIFSNSFIFPYLTIASASACSDLFSNATAMESTVFSLTDQQVTIFVTSGFPCVSVPVLSKMIAWILHAISKGSPHLTKRPYCAHFPVPTMMAVGVASPNAHGHAMTMTAAKYRSELSKLAHSIKYRITNVMIASMITVGTKILEMVSAIDCMGAFDHCASWINFIICDNFVSNPTPAVCISKLPKVFIVPANTSDHITFSTGRLSPVSIDSSTLLYPLIIFPSTGIFSPGLTIIILLIFTSSIGISLLSFPTLTLAVLGANCISFAIDSDVFPLAFASRNFPNEINMMRNAPISK